jgi:signal transduction histidine kinase
MHRVPAIPPYFDRRLVRRAPATLGPARLLAGMRIRKKLVVLHTLFSIGLAAILLVALRPAITEVVEQAEMEKARVILENVASFIVRDGAMPAIERSVAERFEHRRGDARELLLDAAAIQAALATPGRAVVARESVVGPAAALFAPARPGVGEAFHLVSVRMPETRRAAMQVYWLLVVALLAVYAIVALALEVVVLPSSVYAPIQRMLVADAAVQSGLKTEELIPEESIPGDELGAIMRSRNESVIKLRRQEEALGAALSQLEAVATDLKRKNHLLETAQRNLAESDRLASLGMLSAGIAHELNTPLAVLKGCVEQLQGQPGRPVDPATAALMLRVVSRLEKLGLSLLDFARVRPPDSRHTSVRETVQEAITLVRLDRDARGIDLVNDVPSAVALFCDGDRMVQVFVNLIRNAVDSLAKAGGGTVRVESAAVEREGRPLVSISVVDDGPGIDAAVLAHLFEPFVSTRLDSRGTGLGLAVAEGIVKEHGGTILARNRADRSGAIFEVVMPAEPRETRG